jgi:hypothetical protein
MKTIGRLLIVGLVCSSSLLMAGLVNPGFETGDLTGWSSLGSVGVSTGDWTGPLQGTYFAELTIADVSCGTMESTLGLNGQICALSDTYGGTLLYQSVSMAASETITEWANFKAWEHLPYDDFGFWAFSGPGVVINAGVIASVATVGNYGTSGWVPVTFTAPQTGTYTIALGVMNEGDIWDLSQLGVDDNVPEPATWLAVGLGMGVLAAVRRRRAR